jgi:gamma-glutamyltranspeptidase/glutathione hydrolase
MLEMAHQKYGKLPWAKLFDPAIKLADDGFAIGPKLAATIASHAAMAAKMPDFKRYFFHADGTPMAQGEILKNPKYAATLRAIAKDGAKAFYSGPIAQAIVDAVNNAPVNKTTMTLADLASYKAVERPAVCGMYRARRICSMGPPSSGGVAIVQILGMLEHFPSKDLAPTTLSGVHLFTQASRLAFADRAMYLADPDSVNVPVAGLTDPGYLADRAKLIDPKKDMGKAEAGTPPQKHAEYAPQRSPQLPGTSHLSAVDDNGMAVSMTMTIESAFGDYMMANGFFLNNELTDFSFDPMLNGKPVANAPAPGKRPLSAMSPTLVFGRDGKFWIATGSPGGPLIIDFVAQSLIAMIDTQMKPQATTALPRVVNLNSPTILEKGTAVEALIPQLKAMGHQVVSIDIESGLHIVQRVKGGYIGGADPRRDGNVAGD